MSSSSARATPAPSEAGATSRINRDPRQVENDSKVAKPDLYHGDRNNLDDWLNQLELYFLFNSVPPERKSLFATTYMRGRAQHWIKPFLGKFLQDHEDEDEIFGNFNNFKTEIKRIFGISNEKATAVRVIQHLRQRTSAAEYAAKFQEYAQLTDWDDAALMTMF